MHRSATVSGVEDTASSLHKPATLLVLCWTVIFNGIRLTSSVEPSFDSLYDNVTSLVGQSAVLTCSIDRLAKYKVAWLNPKSFPLTYEDRRVTDDARFSVIRPFIKEWNLHIRDVRRTDRGDYRCIVNTVPVISRVVTLHIRAPPQIIDKLSSRDVIATEGDAIVLTCNVTGEPYPEVTWYRHPLTGSSWPSEPEIMGSSETLAIDSISRDTAGLYECVAYNGVPPTVKRQMLVTVHFKPEVTVLEPKLSRRRGEDVTLECETVAQPVDECYWERNSYRLRPTAGKYDLELEVIETVSASENAVRHRLTIYRLTDSDFGAYTCVSINHVGKSRSTAVVVEYPEVEQATVATASRDKGRHASISTQRSFSDVLPNNVLQTVIKTSRLTGNANFRHSNGSQAKMTSPPLICKLLLMASLLIRQIAVTSTG